MGGLRTFAKYFITSGMRRCMQRYAYLNVCILYAPQISQYVAFIYHVVDSERIKKTHKYCNKSSVLPFPILGNVNITHMYHIHRGLRSNTQSGMEQNLRLLLMLINSVFTHGFACISAVLG